LAAKYEAAAEARAHRAVKKITWLPDKLYVILLKGGVTADKGDTFGLCLSYD
jgi:hypothetical protein